MGTCVICGKSVSGKVCESHEEDVLFEFEGESVDQLMTGRYYRGTVDGFADFGVFVDLAPGVTGLLHRSEIPGRLESLDWDVGDSVYVQVTGVHEIENVDLGWSIRQSEQDFRDHLVQEPSGDREVGEAEEESQEPASTTSEEVQSVEEPEAPAEPREQSPTEPVSEPESGASEAADQGVIQEERPAEIQRVQAERLTEQIGNRVRLEGEVKNVRQTSGPTVFTVADETGEVECAAFEAPGERAYPGVEASDVVRVVGEVERRRGGVQVETELLDVLGGEEREGVVTRLREAREEAARPPREDLLVEDASVEELS
ncbi:MAG: OB-fold nucleic acid binding domain-containing protein, partial [Halobacteriaceae archaeon]